jgi:glycosyltransferase involved in cell wall biosynthesis
MNILLTLHNPLDPNAGAASVTLKLGDAYKKLGHSVSFYSLDDLPKGLPYQVLYLMFPFYVAFHIISLSRRVELDVIHASSVDTWFWAFILRKFSFGSTPILAIQSHGLEHTIHERVLKDAKNGELKLSWIYPLYNGSILLWKTEVSCRTADYSFFLNQYDAETIKRRTGLSSDRVKVFINGIPDDFIGLKFEKTSSDSTPQIALIGSYIDRKGIGYSVPALNVLMKKEPQLRIHFLGTGCPPEKVLMDFSAEVKDRVNIVPFFDKLQLPHLLKNCRILLFPSLSEGFPLALVEAMACGLAPIVTRIPGPTEIIKNNINGILIDARNQSQIEDAVLNLLKNRDHLEKLRLQAYETVQAYEWSDIASQHMKLYESRLISRSVN